jgi:hypothetical protein
MGCLRKIGCLALLVVLVAVGFLGRGLWLPKIRGTPKSGTSAAAEGTWQPLTTEGGRRAQHVIAQLSQPNGPPSVNVTPGELASYVVQQLSQTLPASADSIQASAIGDRLCVRTVVKTSEIADRKTLGPLAMLLGEREPVMMCGTIRIHSPGKGELQVKEFKIRELAIPGPAIPRIIRQMTPGERSPELADNGLPLQTPPYIGDVKVANGQITISRTAPGG